jgi:hypothetical protein
MSSPSSQITVAPGSRPPGAAQFASNAVSAEARASANDKHSPQVLFERTEGKILRIIFGELV